MNDLVQICINGRDNQIRHLRTIPYWGVLFTFLMVANSIIGQPLSWVEIYCFFIVCTLIIEWHLTKKNIQWWEKEIIRAKELEKLFNEIQKVVK